MTTYTAISATETQSGKPITESLMTRLANNLVAVTEGDPTAPIIYPKIMPQDSGGLKLETSRSGSWLQSTGSGYYEYLVINYTSDFPAAITCDIVIDYAFAGGGTSYNYELRLDGTVIDTDSNSGADTWMLSYDLPAGTHTLSFRARNQFGNSSSVLLTTATMTAIGSWL